MPYIIPVGFHLGSPVILDCWSCIVLNEHSSSWDGSISSKVCLFDITWIGLKLISSPPHLSSLPSLVHLSSSWVVDSASAPPRLPLPADAPILQVFGVLSGELSVVDGSHLLGLWQCHPFPHPPIWPMIDRFRYIRFLRGFSGGSVVKNLSANAGHMGSIPGLGTSHMLWNNSGVALAPGSCNCWAHVP